MKKNHQLRVDWPQCEARGLCHELLPEIVDLDPWGYPIIQGEVTPHLIREAREAVAACPRLALRLIEVAPPARQGVTNKPGAAGPTRAAAPAGSRPAAADPRAPEPQPASRRPVSRSA